MSDHEKANSEFPSRNDIWRNKASGVQYEVIIITNIPNRKEEVVSIFNHQEGKAKLENLQYFINAYEKICEFPDR